MELFNRAVEQLGHDRLEVRLGAIYTLREIDRDFSDLCGPVFELLSTYVRERTKASSEETPQIDTAAIIEFLRNKLSSPKSGG